MPNQRHLDLLKEKSVSAWNKYRKQHPEEQPDLSNADLHGAKLNEILLNSAYLEHADLSGANLSNANLHHANLSGAIFRGTNLTNTNLSHALLRDTLLAKVDLRTVKGLDTVHHLGPSTIGLDTISLSKGKIPESLQSAHRRVCPLERLL